MSPCTMYIVHWDLVGIVRGGLGVIIVKAMAQDEWAGLVDKW